MIFEITLAILAAIMAYGWARKREQVEKLTAERDSLEQSCEFFRCDYSELLEAVRHADIEIVRDIREPHGWRIRYGTRPHAQITHPKGFTYIDNTTPDIKPPKDEPRPYFPSTKTTDLS